MTGLLDGFVSVFEACNTIFHDLSRPVEDVFGLKNLGRHFDVFVYSFALFNFANIVLVPGFSRLFFDQAYGALDVRARNKWYVTFFPNPLPRRDNISRKRIAHVWVWFCEADLYSPNITQELPWRVIGPRIDCDSLGHPMPRFSCLICRSGI